MLQQIRGSSKFIGSSKQCLYLSSKHIQVKWFCDKIITAHVDCHDDAHIIRSGRKEKHRYFRHFPDLLAPVVTVKKGKMNVHQHQLRTGCGKFCQHIGKILHTERLHAPRNQVLPDRICNHFIIFHDHNSIHIFLIF